MMVIMLYKDLHIYILLFTDQKIVNAVKQVAEVIGGDKKSTESELLMKLLSPEETSSKNLT